MTDPSVTQDITVVVPTIGRQPQLGGCVASILACDPGPAEVVLVEQRGAGVAADLARSVGDARIVVLEDSGTGAARARNQGARRATHPLLAFTDDDCEVEPNWIAAAFRLHHAYPDALLTGQVLAGGGAGEVPSTIVGDRPRDYSGTVSASALYSNNMVIAKDLLLDFGAFDERIFVAEDNDLCFRWLGAGRRLRFEPELVVTHLDWRTQSELEALRLEYAWSQGMVYAKHLKAGNLRILKPMLHGAIVSARARARRGSATSTDTPAAGRELRSLIANWRLFQPWRSSRR